MRPKQKFLIGWMFAGLVWVPAYAGEPVGTETGKASDAATEAPEAPVTYPNISIEGKAELQFDAITPSDDPTARVRAAYATIEPEITLNLSEQFRLFTHLVYEPVIDADAETSPWFSNEGLYAEELYAQASFGPVDVSAGLVDPVFGLASDDAPGIYGDGFASAYDLNGALGAGVNWQIGSPEADNGGGVRLKQTLSFSVFSADTSVLSRSLFIDRGQLSRSDGGVGNSERPESFSLAYSVGMVGAEDTPAGPSGRIAVRRLAAGVDGGNDEWGFVANAEDVFNLGDDVTLTALAEVAYFVDQGGSASNAATATAGAEIGKGPYVASLVTAFRDGFGDNRNADVLVTASLGEKFEFDRTGAFRVDIGYARDRQDGMTANTVGVRLHKDFSWSSLP